jgi:hypothetical protein
MTMTVFEARSIADSATPSPTIAEFCKKMDKAIKRAAKKGLRCVRWKGSYSKWSDYNTQLRELYMNNGFGFRLEQTESGIYEVIYW